MIGLAAVGIILFFLLIIGVTYVNISNKEIRLRNQSVAIQLDNQNEFDNMWKSIEQVANVTRAERESVERIIVQYADVRTGAGGGGSFINAVREALPNIDNTTFVNLQNIIVASRNRFTQRQTRLVDIKREHDDILMTFPGNIFVGGRPQLNIVIVTSTRTEDAFRIGRDDNLDLGF